MWVFFSGLFILSFPLWKLFPYVLVLDILAKKDFFLVTLLLIYMERLELMRLVLTTFSTKRANTFPMYFTCDNDYSSDSRNSKSCLNSKSFHKLSAFIHLWAIQMIVVNHCPEFNLCLNSSFGFLAFERLFPFSFCLSFFLFSQVRPVLQNHSQ